MLIEAWNVGRKYCKDSSGSKGVWISILEFQELKDTSDPYIDVPVMNNCDSGVIKYLCDVKGFVLKDCEVG